MFTISRRHFLTACAGAAGSALVVPAFTMAAELNRGFEKTAPAYASGEELNRQRNIWVMEVSLKPMRMIFINRVDPKTGQTKKDQIWYLAYRAINRPLPGRKADDDVTPQNEVEPLPGQDKFIPELTLVTYDDPKSQIPSGVYHDVILPAADRRINAIERRPGDDAVFLDSVSVVRDLPEPVDASAEVQPYVYGVATWKNVDPDADFFKVILRGFSNGYQEVPGPDGKPIVTRKVLVQKFIRRGDRFDPNQAEFLFDGNPTWEYQPDEVPTGAAATTDAAVNASPAN